MKRTEKSVMCKAGQNYVYNILYIRCMYGILSRDFTQYTVIYDVFIRFWPTLIACSARLFRS